MNNYNLYNLAFEKSILSSIIFDPSQFDELSTVLKIDDFYLPAHQKIFNVMMLLLQKDQPIDEEFIKKELIKINKFDEKVMLEILSANPISNLKAYIDEIKSLSYNRQIVKTTLQIQGGKLEKIEELQNLKFQLDNVGSHINYQKNDKNISNIFDKFDIDFAKIDSIKSEYLFDNFLVVNEITMISARPAEGKSLLTVALCNMLLQNDKIEQVFYLDGDNSAATLKDRNIHHLKQQHNNRFRYFCGLQKIELQKIIQTLLKIDLSNCLIVFDSIKNFITGDRDKNKDVSKVMDALKALRNKGATVIFLHHNNKKQKDFESDFAGSSAFAEDTSNAFKLVKNEHKKALILVPYKARVGKLEPIAFMHNSNHTLTKIDYLEACETQEIEEINDEIKSFIEEQNQKPNYSKIMQHLQKEGFPRNKSNLALQNGKNRYWKEEKLTQNNRSVYTLIIQVVETVFEDISESSLNKSDKSYKSIYRGSLDDTPIQDKPDKSQVNPIISDNLHIEIPYLTGAS